MYSGNLWLCRFLIFPQRGAPPGLTNQAPIQVHYGQEQQLLPQSSHGDKAQGPPRHPAGNLCHSAPAEAGYSNQSNVSFFFQHSFLQ